LSDKHTDGTTTLVRAKRASGDWKFWKDWGKTKNGIANGSKKIAHQTSQAAKDVSKKLRSKMLFFFGNFFEKI
jgi:hypothetical protein